MPRIGFHRCMITTELNFKLNLISMLIVTSIAVETPLVHYVSCNEFTHSFNKVGNNIYWKLFNTILLQAACWFGVS